MLVSSHVLDEVERFGSRVLVMAQGRLAAEGDFHAIRELMDNRPHRLRVRTDRPHALGAELLASATVVGVWVAGPAEVVVDTSDVAGFRLAVAPAAVAAGARLLELVPLDDDLESVFRYLVGAGGPQRTMKALWRMFLATQVTKGRLVGLGALGALAVVLGVAVGAGDGDDPVGAGIGLVSSYGLALFVPVTTLVFASAVLGEPNEDGTLVYLWLRPLARWRLVAVAPP